MDAMTHGGRGDPLPAPVSGSGRWLELTPEILDDQPDYCLGAFGEVFVVIWRTDTTLPAVASMTQAFDRFAAKIGHPVGLLTVVEEAAPLPSTAAREAIATFLRNNGARVRASAVVFEGSGFRAAAVRSVVVGLTMLANQPFPHRVFSTIDKAREWFVENLGDERQVRSASALARAVDTIRGAKAAAAVG